MPTKIGSAFFDVTFNTAAARREVTALVSTANRQFGLLGGIGVVGATIALGAMTRATFDVGSAALTAANQYEQAFASVQKTLDTTGLSVGQAEGRFRELSNELKELALVTPLSLSEDLAPIAALGGQLGIAAEDIKEFTDVIAQVGVTTNVAVEDAAISFARIANIMGIPESQFRQFGDTLIHLGNNLATREDEILNFALRIAAAGDIAGFTSDEVLALSAAMSAVGVPAERGGTAVQRVLIEITESVATADDRLQLFARTAGVSADEFAAAWQTDASGAFLNFVEGLGAAGTDAFTILDELELGNLRTIQSFLSLANAGPLLRDSFTLAAESANALKIEAEIFFNTTEANITRLGNLIENAGIRVGDKIQEPFNDIIDSVREWITLNPELISQLGTNLATALGNLEAPLIRVIDFAARAVAAFAELAASAKFEDFADDASAFLQRGFAFDPHLAGFGARLEEIRRAPQNWAEEVASILLGPIPDIFSFFVEESKGALTLVEEELRTALEGGGDPLDHLVNAFIDLEDRLEPLGLTISKLGFAELTNEVELTAEQTRELIDLLRLAGVALPQGLIPTHFPGAVPGRPELPRALVHPGADPIAEEIRRRELLADAEAAAAEQAAMFADALAGVRDAASDLSLPIGTVLENIQLLPPEVAELVRQFGAADVEMSLFNESLLGLETALEFDTGAAATQIDVLTGAVEEANTSLGEVQGNAEEALNQLATFEARLALFEVLGLDQLVTTLETLPFGTAVHLAEDAAADIEGAFAFEATLDFGGVADEDALGQLSAALATVDLTPEAMDMAAAFTSDQVMGVVADAGREQGLEMAAALEEPAVQGAFGQAGAAGGVEFGAGVQSALDQLGLSVDVALELGVIDPMLRAILTHSGVKVDVDSSLRTRVPTHVDVHIQSSGTTAGDAARAGQAINSIVTVN